MIENLFGAKLVILAVILLMTNSAQNSDPIISHLIGLQQKVKAKPTDGVISSAIAEAKEIIQQEEGLTSNFVFNLGAIPVRMKIPTAVAPQFIDAIDSYINYRNANLPKKKPDLAPDIPVTKPFVHPVRIEELRRLTPSAFDLSRLIRLCEELNSNYASGSFLSVAMATRSLLDHVPPIFGKKTFAEVANNYNGGKSFKEAMLTLENSNRKIADGHLHTAIRQKEVLPTSTQIDCSAGLDALLGELIRVLK